MLAMGVSTGPKALHVFAVYIGRNDNAEYKVSRDRYAIYFCDRQTDFRKEPSVKGSGRKFFSPPRACALRNGRVLAWRSRPCSFSWSVLTAACARFTCMPPSKRNPNRSKRASSRRAPVLSRGGSDYILEQPVGPPGPWPGSSHAHRRWASDVPWSIPSRQRLVQRPACRSARALKSHLFHRCRLEETAGGALLLTERS